MVKIRRHSDPPPTSCDSTDPRSSSQKRSEYDPPATSEVVAVLKPSATHFKPVAHQVQALAAGQSRRNGLLEAARIPASAIRIERLTRQMEGT